MEVRPDRENKTQFFPSIGHVDTAIWMHNMDVNFLRRKDLTTITQECNNPGGNTLKKNSSCPATYNSSQNYPS